MRRNHTIFYHNRLGLQVSLFAALAAILVTSITLFILLHQLEIDWWHKGGLIAGLITFLIAQAAAVGLTTLIFHDRFIARPLKNVAHAAHAIVGGNLDVDIPIKGRGDELGDIAKALEVFRSSQLQAQKIRLENETLKSRMARDSRVMMRTLEKDFDDSFAALAGILSKTAPPEKDQRTLAVGEQASPELAALAKAAANARRDIAKELNRNSDARPREKKKA